jgi:hypothetical protein
VVGVVELAGGGGADAVKGLEEEEGVKAEVEADLA